jgi:hypothetical protein
MSKLILTTLMLLLTFPVYAGDKQSPRAYTDEDLEQYSHGPDAVFPEGHETIEQYEAKKEQERTLEDVYYDKQAIEIDRICREEARHREDLQHQEDIKEEIEILRGNLAVQKYGAYPGVKVARDRTRERFSSQKFYYNCIKDSGIPPKYFGLDRW